MKTQLKIKAREMRHQGVSVRQIAKQLKIAKSSASVWVRDVSITNEQHAVLKEGQRKAIAEARSERFYKRRLDYQEIGRKKINCGDSLYIAGCMLYWAEGSKKRNSIIFTNTDVSMLKLFMRFLREKLDVLDEDITLDLQYYEDAGVSLEDIKQFWMKELNMDIDSFRTCMSIKGKGTKKTIHKHGICRLMVHQTKKAQEIYGAIQQFGEFKNNDWLNK